MDPMYEIINQIALMENKLKQQEEFGRYFARCKSSLEELGYTYYSPINEKYTETRTDVEAHITGNSTSNMKITDVIKPVLVKNGAIVQRGIVIVEGAE